MTSGFKKEVKAFTLIELVIALAVLSILAATIVPVLTQGIDAWIMLREQKEIIERASLAMNRMLGELRADCILINDPSNAGTISFNTSSSSVSYSVSNGNLIRTENGTPRILGRNFSSLNLTYFRRYSASTAEGLISCSVPISSSPCVNTDPSNKVRFVRIRVTLLSDLDPTRTYVFESGVSPRQIQ